MAIQVNDVLDLAAFSSVIDGSDGNVKMYFSGVVYGWVVSVLWTSGISLSANSNT